MIPKIVHYCWFGKNPESKLMQKCIASWEKYLPDYEIIRWDETNSPLQYNFLQNALKNKLWAKASDFVRFFAIYNFGGIYFDTDVEVLQSFDPLLKEKCFFGFQSLCEKGSPPLKDGVATGVFGAEKGNAFAKQMLEELEKKHKGTEPSLFSGPRLVSKFLIKKGLKQYSDSPCKVAGVTIFPLQYFYPFPTNLPRKEYGADTFSIHHWQASWVKTEGIRARVKHRLHKIRQTIHHLAHD